MVPAPHSGEGLPSGRTAESEVSACQGQVEDVDRTIGVDVCLEGGQSEVDGDVDQVEEGDALSASTSAFKLFKIKTFYP